jgi:hypothetical protein
MDDPRSTGPAKNEPLVVPWTSRGIAAAVPAVEPSNVEINIAVRTHVVATRLMGSLLVDTGAACIPAIPDAVKRHTGARGVKSSDSRS